MIEDKKSRHKSKILPKKSKKSKPTRELPFAENSSDSENQLQRAHIVNTKIEMPDGVILSDNDDADMNLDANDPHRALNINFGDTSDANSYNVEKKSKHKSKESKKDKKEKIPKKSKKHTKNIIEAPVNEYEETFGISTPSKELNP